MSNLEPLNISPRIDNEAQDNRYFESPAQELSPKDPHAPNNIEQSLSLVSQPFSAPFGYKNATGKDVPSVQIRLGVQRKSIKEVDEHP